MFKRIGYVSKFSRQLTQSEIDTLGTDAAEYNRSVEITGMLVATGSIFYQVLEGPQAAVDKLFEKIASDRRHRDFLILDVQEGLKDRQFPDWSMKTVNLDAEGVERLAPIKALLEAIVDQRESLHRLMGILSSSVWHEMTEGE